MLLGRLAQFCETGFALAVRIRLTRPTWMHQTYDVAWTDEYSENGYMLTDPVVIWGLSHTGRVWWDDLADQDNYGVLRRAKAHGLHHGWTYATGDSDQGRSIAGMTRPERPHNASEIDEIVAIIEEIHALIADFDSFSAQEKEALRRLQT